MVDTSSRRPDIRQMSATAPYVVSGLTHCWRDGRHVFAQGWLIAPDQRITAVEVQGRAGRQPGAITQSPDRDDAVFFLAFFEDHLQAEAWLVVHTAAGHSIATRLDLTAATDHAAELAADAAEEAINQAALQRFADEVNEGRLELLELGGRVLPNTTSSWRERFGGARRYIGFDIHEGPGVDVAGDAHRLSDVVGRAAVDAIFSVAVLEHIAMPWIVARECNRTLRMGGILHITTHQSWPVHERPNDFWRFSDEALKLLFGPMHGFEVLEAGMNGRIVMSHRTPSLAHASLPTNVSYRGVWIFSRKVAEVDALPTEPGARELAELSRLYPPPNPPAAGPSDAT
jgi:hypothetical protein